MTSNSYIVLGAGNGGCAMAAELALFGRDPVLFDHAAFEHQLSPLRAAGGISVESRIAHFAGGIGTHLAPLPRITNDIAAVADASVVIVVVPAQHHAALVQQALPHLRRGQIVLLNPGGVGGGAVLWAWALKQAGVEGVLLAQAADGNDCRGLGFGPADRTRRVANQQLPDTSRRRSAGSGAVHGDGGGSGKRLHRRCSHLWCGALR
jgi:ketopantoate reductase